MAASPCLGIPALSRRRTDWCTEREPFAFGALSPGGRPLARLAARDVGPHDGRVRGKRLRVDVERNISMTRRPLALLALALLGCATSSGSSTEMRPKELIGSWVLLRPDGSWGDTATFGPDGSVRGSTGHPIPPDASWGVRTPTSGAPLMCIRGGGEGNCQPYTMSADTLVWGVGASADRFRRVGSTTELRR